MGKQPVLLCILDGWGEKTGKAGDTFSFAKTPNFDRIKAGNLATSLKASGLAVGLPEGQMGNSEVGHLNIGAGRVVYQDLTAITKDIEAGVFNRNVDLMDTFAHINSNGGRLHLFGLLSDGGVHSHIDHLFALIKMAKRFHVKEVFIHCFMDGRDVPPNSGAGYIARLSEFLASENYGSIGVVTGRFYAMDRDNRWERVERAYRAMTLGDCPKFATAGAGIEASYEVGILDEFIEPFIVNEEAVIQNNDGVVFFNFRADRAREITRAFIDEEFSHFSREYLPDLLFTTMTEYDASFDVSIAYSKRELVNTLGEVVANDNRSQLRIAETEKYAHVTFFFNGGVEKPNEYEDRVLIASPKVKTYDLQPEMSARGITEKLLGVLEDNPYDLIVLNFANPDMVGHTGIIPAAVVAVEVVDECLGLIIDRIIELGGSALITADHGNVEEMLTDDGSVVTAHTVNEVPCIVVNSCFSEIKSGSLCDIAPTVLELLNIDKPVEMTGTSLLKK